MDAKNKIVFLFVKENVYRIQLSKLTQLNMFASKIKDESRDLTIELIMRLDSNIESKSSNNTYSNIIEILFLFKKMYFLYE